jgi:hypothetical protein
MFDRRLATVIIARDGRRMMTMKVTGSTMDVDAIARFVFDIKPREFAFGRLQRVDSILTRCVSEGLF